MNRRNLNRRDERGGSVDMGDLHSKFSCVTTMPSVRSMLAGVNVFQIPSLIGEHLFLELVHFLTEFLLPHALLRLWLAGPGPS